MNLPFLPKRKTSALSNSAPHCAAIFTAIVALFFVVSVDQAQAQRSWLNPADKVFDYQNTGGAWSPDWWAPQNGTTLIFDGGNNDYTGNITNNSTDWNDYAIVFQNGMLSVTLTGNAIDLTTTNGTTAKIENLTANTQTIAFNAISMANGVRELNPVDGDIVINSANIYMGNAGTGGINVWGDNGKTLWLNGVVSESGTLGIQQNSTVVFQQINTYTGQTYIHGGQLIISNGARAGTGNINLGGTNVAGVSRTNAFYLGMASSTGGVTNTNQININAGGGASTIGANNTSGVNSFTGPIVLSTNVSANVASGGTLTFNGIVSGSGFGVTKIGSGILIYSNANTYTGTTTVSAGTLRLGTGGSISDSSALSIASGATFDLNGINDTVGALSGAGTLSLGAGNFTTTVGAASTFSGDITGSGAFGKAGSSTLTLSGNSSTFSGAVNVTAGAVRVSSANALGNTTGTTGVSSGAALELTAAPGAEAISINGSGISSGGALRNISGNNSLSGLITLAGASRINSDSGTLTLDVTSGNAITGTHNLTIGGAGNVTINDNVNITTGTLTKDGAGVLTLAGTQTYTGATTVTNGTLVVNGSIAGSTVSVGNATTEDGSVLMGTGTVGATTIDNNGRISPGNSVGTLNVTTSLTLNNGGSYLWEVNGTNGAAGTTWDLISVNDVGTGDGTLNLPGSGTFIVEGVAIDAFVFDGTQNYTGNYFQIIAADTVTGSIGNLSFSSSGLGAGSWTFATNNTGLFLNYAAPGFEIVFDNSAAADQGAASIVVGGNTAGQYATITDDGGVTAVVISNSAPMTFTNGANSYSGTTKIEQGTLVTTVDAPNGANGAFGNAISTVDVGSASVANANAANLLIGSGGVSVGRGITIVAGGSGTRTIGATNSSGTATYSGGILMNTNVTLSASNAAGTTLFSGTLSGIGAVSVAGPGTVVLSGNNSFTNTVSVASGSTLVASNNNALGGAGGAATTVTSGGTLGLAGGISTAENVTIAGTGVGGNGALRNVSGNNTNSGTITLSANATISAGTGTALELNNVNLTGANNRSVTFTGSGNTTIKGNVSTFAGSLTNNIIKDGTGSLIVDNNGTSGAGQLNVINGSVTIANGSLTTSTNTGTRAVDLGTGPGGDSANNVAFYANSGITVSNSFYVAPNTSSALRTVGSESTTGTITYNNQFYLGGNVRLTSAGTANVVFSGNITNDLSHSVTKIGAGTVTLSGVNTYSGTAVVEEGTLALSGGSALANTVGVTVNGGSLAVNTTETIGTLSGSGGSVALNAGLVTGVDATATSYSGVFTGTSSLSKNGTGTLTLNGNSTGYSGEVILNEGALLAGNAGAFGTGTVTINFDDGAGTRTLASSSATGYTLNNNFNLYYNAFTLGQTEGGTGSLTLGGSGKTFYLGEGGANEIRGITVNGSHTIASVVTGGSTKTLAVAGGGSLTLSGANTFSGGAQLREGTILVGNNAALGTGTLQIQFDQTGTRTLASSSSTAYTLNNSVNIFNSMTLGQTTGGTGSLTLSGTVSLGDPVGEVNSRTVTVNGAHTMSGVIGGGNGLVKAGDGTLTLSGGSANTYTGATTVSAGVLELNKSTGNAIAGNLTVNSGATLLLSGSNQVASSGGQTVTLSGGTIQRSTGVSEVFGNLNLTTGSFLDFGTGTTGTMSFGTYTPSSLLTVNNFFEGNTLTFGSDLTSTINGALFSFDNAFTSSWNSGTSTFTITAIPEPSTYLAAAGLLALFLWPVRRRLIKNAKSILGLRPTGRDRIEAYRNA